jgi:hypothetical protein
MPELTFPTVDGILKEIGHVAETYYRLLLLVARTSTDASQWMTDLAARLDRPVTNLNAELSSALLDVPHRQRKLKAHKAVGNIIDCEAAELILLDHTDILFSPALQLDAVTLLKSLSRNKTMVATWRGEIKDGKVQHAEEWHPEYQIHSVDDIRAIAVDKDASERTLMFGGAFDR